MQICESVQFMYENHVAHRYVTCKGSGMFPESFHPTEIGRSKDFRRKVKCYGLPLDKPLRGGNNRPRSTRIG
ncbi:hypothetical protein BJV77DRAFT_1004725 [Russula vinacea]|nr:hypothetical protein BJV77DRAFT_1004725 [Russula vinacea]